MMLGTNRYDTMNSIVQYIHFTHIDTFITGIYETKVLCEAQLCHTECVL